MTRDEIQEIANENRKLYYKKYYEYAKRHLPDRYAAESCVQETFLILQENLTKEKTIHNYDGWMFRILCNVINRYLNEQNKRSIHEVGLDYFNLVYGDFIDPDMDLELNVEQNGVIDIIISRAEQLGDKDKSLFKRKYINNEKYADIADETRESVDCLKKRNQRLKPKLAELFKDIIPDLNGKGAR